MAIALFALIFLILSRAFSASLNLVVSAATRSPPKLAFNACFRSRFSFPPQLLKRGMHAFALSRSRRFALKCYISPLFYNTLRLTSDRLLSVAVALRRQTLARDAIASGERARSNLLIRSSICGMRLFFYDFCRCVVFTGCFCSAALLLCKGFRVDDGSGGSFSRLECARSRMFVQVWWW